MIHETILKQLGGNRFLVMTGSKNLMYSKEKNNFLSMHLKRNKIKAKYLKIVLNSMDTYDMIFSTIDKDYNHIILAEINNVYDDQLQEIFTEKTGLLTYL